MKSDIILISTYVNNFGGWCKMSRPRKCRKVCSLPKSAGFLPVAGEDGKDAVFMTVDEYEAIRLIDKEKFSQEECVQYMNVARTTIQAIYTSAREKIAIALVEGRALKIEGGDYRLCDGQEEYCACGGCPKHRFRKEKASSVNGEEKHMRVAIPLDEGKEAVCVSFGRAPYFLFADLETQELKIEENPAANAQGGAGILAAQFLVDNKIQVLITVRCGENSAEVFGEAGIAIYKSSVDLAKDNLELYKEGKLETLTKFHAGFHGAV